MANVDVSGYNDVASRMREFFEKHPEGRLVPASAWRIQTIGDKTFIVYEAAAYRTRDDTTPGIGTAWEPFPGRTPYTRDSELMNAETSAWGRAILAVGAADTRKGIASAEEIRNRQADEQASRERWEDARPARPVSGPPVGAENPAPPKVWSDAEVEGQQGKLRTLELGAAVKMYDWMARKDLHERRILTGGNPEEATASEVLACRMAVDALSGADVRAVAIIKAYAEDRGLLKVQVSEQETLDQALHEARELAQHAQDEAVAQAKADTPDPQDT